MKQSALRWPFAPTVVLLLLAGCSTAPKIPEPRDGPPLHGIDIDAIPDAVPRREPRTSAGNPPFYDVFGKRYYVLPESRGYVQKGLASWYGRKFHGLKTSNGENYDMLAMTAAHKTLPIPCYAKVTNLENNRSIVVRINDRGPFHDGRIIDLSYVAAAKLRIHEKGTALVEVSAVEPSAPATLAAATGNSALFLQLGAFSDKNNAQRLQSTVASLILHPTRILRGRSGGREIYRVQLGPIATPADADRILRALSAQGITETRFVTERTDIDSSMLQ